MVFWWMSKTWEMSLVGFRGVLACVLVPGLMRRGMIPYDRSPIESELAMIKIIELVDVGTDRVLEVRCLDVVVLVAVTPREKTKKKKLAGCGR